MEVITIKTKYAKLSDDQFFKLCSENDNIRFERDKDKNIIIMAPTGWEVEEFETSILTEVKNWNRKHKLGYVNGSNAGFFLQDTSMRAPDVSWTNKERIAILSQKEKEQFLYLCPDFIVEVISKSDTLKHQQEKMDEWVKNGIRLGWLVDYKHRTTYIYKPNSEIIKKSFDKILSGEGVLPGFKLKMEKLLNN
jgi:Uma2 family endonuclease